MAMVDMGTTLLGSEAGSQRTKVATVARKGWEIAR